MVGSSGRGWEAAVGGQPCMIAVACMRCALLKADAGRHAATRTLLLVTANLCSSRLRPAHQHQHAPRTVVAAVQGLGASSQGGEEEGG